MEKWDKLSFEKLQAMYEQLEKENKNLKEFKTKREESMFYFKAQMERAEPKTASEAEDLQKAKEIFEKLYREELSCLEEENKKLKSDLSECECSLWFENDEVWYRKREYKRLKKWIKDHCKWYWNLFPEDEMKRQRKKADKKRK